MDMNNFVYLSIAVLGSRPSATNIPGSLKNNSAITITSKVGPRPGFQRVLTRPMGQNKMVRPMLPGQKIAEIRNRLGELRAFPSMRPRSPVHHSGRIMRPSLPGSVSITKIPKDTKKSDTENSDSNATNKMDVDSEGDTQVLDSDEEESNSQNNPKSLLSKPSPRDGSSKDLEKKPKQSMDRVKQKIKSDQKPESTEPLVLTTDEKLPTEEALENKTSQDNAPKSSSTHQQQPTMEQLDSHAMEPVERKINLLKNYRHQRPGSRPQTESSLTQLERTASTLTKESLPDFRRNLDDITQSYSPNSEERPGSKSKKKKSPSKPDGIESQISEKLPAPSTGMSHSVSSLLGPTSNNVQKPRKPEQNTVPVAPIENSGTGSQRLMSRPPMGMSPEASMVGMSYPHGGHIMPGKPQPLPTGMAHGESPSMPSPVPGMPHPQAPMAPGQPYPAANAPPDAPYGQYPGKYFF